MPLLELLNVPSFSSARLFEVLHHDSFRGREAFLACELDDPEVPTAEALPHRCQLRSVPPNTEHERRASSGYHAYHSPTAFLSCALLALA